METTPSSTNDDVTIKTLTHNICEAMGIENAKFVIVIDKQNCTHVFVSEDAEAIGTNMAIDTHVPEAQAPREAHLMTVAGTSSVRAEWDSKGCLWLITSQHTGGGTLLEVSRQCVGVHGGCPVGQVVPHGTHV